MNKFVIGVVAVVALVSGQRALAFGLPKAELPGKDLKVDTGGGAGGGATTQDVDAFITSSLASEVMVRRSSVALGQAVLAKDVMDKLEQRRTAAEAMADGKEKDAQLRKIDADRSAALAKVDYQKVSKEEVSKWDDQKKEKVRSSLFNLALGALIDTELVGSGRKIVSGTPSPAVATRMPLVKDTVQALGSQADSLSKIAGGAKVLMTAVKLDKLPASASEKPIPFDT